MKRLIALVCLLGLAGLPKVVAAQEAEQPLVVPGEQRVGGSVATVSRDIRVDGVVDGDVTSWSGAITIAGSVGGDVVSYGGPVTIMAGGRVGGHVLASGGDLRLASGAVVAGQAISGEGGGEALASLLDLFTPGSAGGSLAVGRVLFGGVLGVLLLAFCWLYSAFWPRRMSIASLTLQRLSLRALALGLLSTVVLGLALPPLAAVLMSSVIGVPVLLALLALVLAMYIYGLAVMARWAALLAAAWAGRATEAEQRTLVSAAILALAIMLAATMQPIWGLGLFCLLASPGLGAAILSRGGMIVPLGAA